MYYTHIDRIHMHLDWLKEKIQIELNSKNANRRKVSRGGVYICKFGRGIGCEQEKERPCVVLQNKDGNDKSPNTIVAPITHTNSTLDVVVPIETRRDADGNILLDGNALLGNIVTISKARLGEHITDLTSEEMVKIEKAMMISLGIDWKNNEIDSLNKRIVDKESFIRKLKSEKNSIDKELRETKELVQKMKVEIKRGKIGV